MARRNAPFEVEQIEQLALIARLTTHHGSRAAHLTGTVCRLLFAPVERATLTLPSLTYGD
jgi:hypothetical protein